MSTASPGCARRLTWSSARIRSRQIAVVGQAYDSFDPLDEWYLAGLLADAAAGAAE
jgi:hypothetical protein